MIVAAERVQQKLQNDLVTKILLPPLPLDLMMEEKITTVTTWASFSLRVLVHLHSYFGLTYLGDIVILDIFLF